MTVSALRSLGVRRWSLPADVRLGRVALTLVASVALLVAALHVPPFMVAGADLTDSGQRDYARNIWQETQTSLALVVLVLPWLVYGLLWPGAAWGRRILLALATAGVVLTTWLALISAQSYAALPRRVTGIVDHVQGRSIGLRSGGSYYLVVSDSELQAAQSWLDPGADVLLWVSPRGHAGYVSPNAVGD